jgi:hypothetical protein
MYRWYDATNSQWLTLKYVNIADAVNVTVGMSLEASTEGPGHVTPDRAGGTAITGLVEGIALGSITADYHGFICVGPRGAQVEILTDGSVAALGEPLVPHATANGQADVGSGEDVFAYATEADDTDAFCTGALAIGE